MPLPDIIRTQRELLSAFQAATQKRAEGEAAANKQHAEAQAAAKGTREQTEEAARKQKEAATAVIGGDLQTAGAARSEAAARLNKVHLSFPGASVPPSVSGVDPERIMRQTATDISQLARQLEAAVAVLQNRRVTIARKRRIALAFGCIILVVIGLIAFSMYKDSLYNKAETATAAENWSSAVNAAERLQALDATRGSELLIELYTQQAQVALVAGNLDVAVIAAERLQSLDTVRGAEALAEIREAEVLSAVTAGKPRPKDGMVMVYVPAGEFQMGNIEGDEEPVHTVALDAFWLDRTEVTNAQYTRCVAAGVCQPSACVDDSNYNGAEQPVVGVSWDDAVTYAAWVGGRLPTEAEWEYAARGSEGLKYPWGNDWREEIANCDEYYCKDGYKYTSPVGSFPQGASWVGALDLAGNVWEWVADWYGDYPSERQINPTGPASGESRVLRGGSFDLNQYTARCSYRRRYFPDLRFDNLGFRVCVVSRQE